MTVHPSSDHWIDPPQSRPAPASGVGHALPWIKAFLVAAALLSLFRINLVRWWEETNPINGSPDWQHAVFLPLVGLAYLFVNWPHVRVERRSASWLGWIILLFGLAAFVYALCMYSEFPGLSEWAQDVASVIALAGVVLTAVGPRIMRWCWFPVLYLILAIPWPSSFNDGVTVPLQRFAASASVFVLQLCGLNADRMGNRIEIFAAAGAPRILNVAEACSGIRSFITFLAIGMAVGFLGQRSLWRKWVIAISALPIAILCNVVRIAGGGLLDHYVSQKVSEGFYHEFIGIMMLIPGFLLVLLTAKLIDAMAESPSPAAGAPAMEAQFPTTDPAGTSNISNEVSRRASGRMDWALIAVLVTLAIVFNSVTARLQLYFHKDPVALREPLATIPALLGAWRQISGNDTPLDADTAAVLGADSYVMRDYVDTRRIDPALLDSLDGASDIDRARRLAQIELSDPRAVVHLGIYYYTGRIDSVTHIPENCYVAAGFLPSGPPENQAWLINALPLAVRVNQFSYPDPLRPLQCTVVYFYQVDGQYVSESWQVRASMLNVFSRHAYYAKMELMSTVKDPVEAQAVLRDFLSAGIASFEHCLPGTPHFTP
jgi:exosortase